MPPGLTDNDMGTDGTSQTEGSMPYLSGAGLLLSVTRSVEAVVAGQTARLCRLPPGKSLCPQGSGSSGGASLGWLKVALSNTHKVLALGRLSTPDPSSGLGTGGPPNPGPSSPLHLPLGASGRSQGRRCLVICSVPL